MAGKIGPLTYSGGARIDMSHLISFEQIDIVKQKTDIGDEISFLKDEEHIEGIVSKKYRHIFMLEDGRTFRWIDYITGSSKILYDLRTFYPITTVHFQDGYNVYRVKSTRERG